MTMIIKILPRSKKRIVPLLLCIVFLIGLNAAGASSRVDVEGIGTGFEVTTQEYQGRTYVDVESLFREIGGIVYYSPIMQKIHLTFRGTKWVLSMDKGTALSETDREIPLGRNVFIQDLNIFIVPELFRTLFEVTITPSDAPAAVSPPPETTADTTQPDRLNILRDIRHSSDAVEGKTRITFDFVSDPPYHTLEVNHPAQQVLIRFSQCSMAQELAGISVGDRRVERVALRRVNDSVEALITLNTSVRVEKGVLGGANPRIFLDIFESVQPEREPVIELVEEGPEVSPSPVVSPTPDAPTPTPATPSPLPTTPQVAPYERVNSRLVVIDPGHGGKDPGAVVGNVREKDVVLQVSLKLRDELIKQGFEVIMTRDGDTYPTLAERTAFANHHHPLLFLSIHANAAPNPRAEGVEVFVGSAQYTGEGAQDVALRENQFFEGQESSIPPVRGNILLESYYYASRDLSMAFGRSLTQSIVAQTGQQNRGLKEAPMIILKGMYFPSALLEIGFLTNSNELSRLTNPAFHDKLVLGIVRAIKEFRESPKFQEFIEED